MTNQMLRGRPNLGKTEFIPTLTTTQRVFPPSKHQRRHVL
jgi:hypothetical protein